MPRVPEADRITVDDVGCIGDGILLVSLRFGYMERPDLPAALRLLDHAVTEGTLDLDNASYFLPRVEVVAGSEPTMAPFRKRLYIAITHMKADAAGFFTLPPDRTVIIGSQFAV